MNSAAAHSAALSLYFEQKWSDVIDALGALLEDDVDDRAVQLMLERAERFLREPPPPDWDGVYRVTTK